MKMSEFDKAAGFKAQDLDEPTTYTIKNVTIETLGQGDEAEKKPALHFEEADQFLALNKTNLRTAIEIYGDDSDGWIGKKITMFKTKTEFNGRRVDAIRIGEPE